jgi:hypothetical protein
MTRRPTKLMFDRFLKYAASEVVPLLDDPMRNTLGRHRTSLDTPSFDGVSFGLEKVNPFAYLHLGIPGTCGDTVVETIASSSARDVMRCTIHTRSSNIVRHVHVQVRSHPRVDDNLRCISSVAREKEDFFLFWYFWWVSLSPFFLISNS